jgi:hypothetical protein
LVGRLNIHTHLMSLAIGDDGLAERHGPRDLQPRVKGSVRPRRDSLKYHGLALTRKSTSVRWLRIDYTEPAGAGGRKAVGGA